MIQHQALEFLKNLDPAPDATFNIEHYTDLPKGKPKQKPDPLAGRYANLALSEVEALLPKLQAINEKGAGIFVARNQCTGHRSEPNVSRIRGVHADMDDVTEVQLDAVMAVLQPSIVVQSSGPNRHQLYWQLAKGEILTKAETKAINQCLAAKHGADSAAVDVSRLLRLPGFKHMKYRADGKTPTVTETFIGRTYTADQIRHAFPTSQVSGQTGKPPINIQTNTYVTQELTPQLSTVATSIAKAHPHLWAGDWQNAVRPSGEIGYPSRSEADLALVGHIVRACHNGGIDADSLGGAVDAVFSSSPMGQTGKWVDRDDYRALTINKALSSSYPLSAGSAHGGLVLESHGDIRNAKAFAQIARGHFLYVATRDRWLQWHQQLWSVCEKDEHVAKAKDVCGRILNAAGSVFGQDQERGKRLVQEAMAAHNLSRITAMLKLAVSEPEMATTDRELDCDPYLLGVRKGVIDLRSGRLFFNQPEMRITRYCNAGFSEDATCPQWLRFLDQIFINDTETIECVQRLLGCTLLGLATEEILIICYGHGSNGKSVFSNVVHKIMGGYAITAPPSLLTARRQDDTGPRNDLAALAGARYVSINEMQAGDRLDEQVVKMLAGREPISARFLHQEFFEFTPSFTPWLRTNHKPIITGLDDGIWRRLVLLPFNRKFTDDEKDPALEQKLLDEQDAILMWMVEGAKLYLQDGIKLSPRMRSELGTYRSESDLLGEFLADQTTTDPTGKASQSLVYSSYRGWCDDCGVRPLSKKTFTQRLAERGYPEGKSGKNRFYTGLVWGAPLSSSTQDGMDGMEGISGISLHGNLSLEKTPDSPSSCPTCSPPLCAEGASHD
jgi:putative DNA primase/helicase